MKKGWKKVLLGELCDIKNGKNQKNVLNPHGKYPIYGSGGIMGYADDYIVKGGSTIIGRKGSINHPLFVKENFWNVDTAFGLQPKDNCDNKFLYYLCRNIDFTLYDKSVTLPSLVKSDLLKIPVSIPPLAEQHHIVEELDLLTEIIEKRKEQLKQLDNLAQSIFYDMFGDPITNEKGWKMDTLGNIAQTQIGITYKPADVSEQGTIVLRSGNIQNNELCFSDILKVNKDIKEKYFVRDGDILMCSRNGSAKLVGKVAKIKNLKERMTYGAFMTIIRSDYPDYLYAYFQTPAFRSQLTTSKTATINQITVKMLSGITLPVPPISLQQSFASKIESIEHQKDLIKQSIKETENLFNSRMDYYFN